MINNKKYTVDDQYAISETLDNETIIINLDTGNYYSMNTNGSLIWNFIQSGYTVDGIINYFKDSSTEESDTIKDAVSSFFELLIKEKLIKEVDYIESNPIINDNKEKAQFIIPSFDKYEDMQEMLLADPIHDVDTMGWPKLKDDK